MIIPKLYGRLGNQCFQIAAAVAHAKSVGTIWNIPRRTEDARYWPNYFLNEVSIRQRSHFFTQTQYNERRHCYDPLPIDDNLTINGYFQSEKYFAHAKYEVGEAIGFNKPYGNVEYIAVHVRRGDYVTDYSNHHPSLDMEYYAVAINYMRDQGFDKFKIYSDDIKWCQTPFNLPYYKNILIEFSTIKDPLADMRDMYNASGFIIANSTFSLFPALLRPDNPLVIAPAESRWYGPANAHLETHDLMPERFIKI